MDNEKKPPRKKTRVTMEKLTQIRQLFREGMPIVQIADATGLHRHTVRTYIKEKFEDVISDEARKESLMEGVKLHFQDITGFALKDLRQQLAASLPQHQQKVVRDPESISTDGMIGIPGTGTPQYMAEEWTRMYDPSTPGYSHLMRSLRIHSKASTLWVPWDRLRKIVAAYENTSKEIRKRLAEEIENIPAKKYSPLDTASFRNRVFGNILLVSGGGEPRVHDLSVDEDSSDGIAPTVRSKESPLSILATELLDEARKKAAWSDLENTMKDLSGSDTQHKLKSLIREIDESLVGIGLMHVFGGRCELCPV